MNTTEYERKQLLTLEQQNLIMEKLNERIALDEVVQVNYYFDDDKFSLFEKKDCLRVRQTSMKLSLEKKYNRRFAADGVKICDESEESIQSLPLHILLEGKRLSCIGTLMTVRKNYRLDDTVISLDTNYYLGETDYEIEIESDKAEIVVPEFISEITCFEKHQGGKYTRFVRKLKEMRLYGGLQIKAFE